MAKVFRVVKLAPGESLTLLDNEKVLDKSMAYGDQPGVVMMLGPDEYDENRRRELAQADEERQRDRETDNYDLELSERRQRHARYASASIADAFMSGFQAIAQKLRAA